MKSAILSLLFLLTTVWPQPASDVKRVALSQEFEIKVGETVSIENKGLQISFRTVAEDSRCPEGMGCVWQGNAKIVLTLSQAGRRPANINLNTTLEPKHKLYDGYDLKLVRLNPYPKKDVRIEKGDYVATLVVSKK